MLFLKSDSGGKYPYYFYVLPDYFVNYDFTNINARTVIDDLTFLPSFKTSLPALTNGLPYPNFLGLQLEDISQIEKPILGKEN